MCSQRKGRGGGLSGMVLSVGGTQAVSATDHVDAGSGSQAGFGAAINPDSRWMPGRPAIARMGALAACLGPTPHAGQVTSSHAYSEVYAILWIGLRSGAPAHPPLRWWLLWKGDSYELGAGKDVGRC